MLKRAYLLGMERMTRSGGLVCLRISASNHGRRIDAPFSSFRKKEKKARPFQSIKIGLTAERPVIYERINKRVDLMIEKGLIQEVESLLSRKRNNALQTVGYRELFAYLEGSVSKEEAIENIKTNTRRFAKRQLTWYRKDPDIKWFDYQTPYEEIVKYITKKTP